MNSSGSKDWKANLLSAVSSRPDPLHKRSGTSIDAGMGIKQGEIDDSEELAIFLSHMVTFWATLDKGHIFLSFPRVSVVV
jgi:hypothetical protein